MKQRKTSIGHRTSDIEHRKTDIEQLIPKQQPINQQPNTYENHCQLKNGTHVDFFSFDQHLPQNNDPDDESKDNGDKNA
jgi:hypothetical protein